MLRGADSMYYIKTKLSYDKTLKDAQNPEQLRLWIVATHSDVPINMRLYMQDEVKKAITTWTTPYQKPVLRHHDSLTDQIGRVTDQVYIDQLNWQTQVKQLVGRSVKLPDGATGGVLIKAYITDQEQIQKILSGAYTTVSVGFSTDQLICNICKKPKMDFMTALMNSDNDFDVCEHQTGEVYDGVTQYDVPINIEYKEISFVNDPADQHAGIAKLEPVSMSEALQEVKSELFQSEDVNSRVEFVDNNNEEVSNMDDEMKQLKDQLQAKDAELSQIKDAYQKLSDEHKQLLDFLKDDYAERVAGLKAIALGIDQDDEIHNIKLSLSTYSLDTLKALETEYRSLVDMMLKREEESEDSKCESCSDEQPQQVEPEKPAEQPAETQQITNSNVNLQKEQNPAEINMYDPNDIIDMLLGIKK